LNRSGLPRRVGASEERRALRADVVLKIDPVEEVEKVRAELDPGGDRPIAARGTVWSRADQGEPVTSKIERSASTSTRRSQIASILRMFPNPKVSCE
jgi:hypothetical protein